MKLNFKWVEKKAQYQTGDFLYLNRICLASYDWNSSRSKSEADDESKRWSGQISLPSLKNKDVYGESPEAIKVKIEQVVTSWFREALAMK